MTEDELESALAENKKSIAGLSNRALIGRVLFTDEPQAVEYVEVELSGVMLLFARDSVPQTLRLLGLISPPRFWKVLEDYAKSDDPELRREVAVALEQLGTEDALRLAKAGLKREKEERLLGAWARALGACGASDKGTRKTLLDLSEEGETPELRASATFALGHLQRHEDIRARWAALLESGTPELTAAAACGVALARDEELKPALDAALAAAEDDQKERLELAVAVLAGGDLYPLGPVVAEITRDDIPRERIFFAGPPSDPGGR
jgi:HEAT repeat protein